MALFLMMALTKAFVIISVFSFSLRIFYIRPYNQSREQLLASILDTTIITELAMRPRSYPKNSARRFMISIRFPPFEPVIEAYSTKRMILTPCLAMKTDEFV